MESLNQKIIKRKTVYENTRKGTLKLAQIADNSSYRKSLQQKKGEKKRGGYAIPKYKIRILGEHSGSLPSQALPWANPPQYSGTNPMVSTGNPFFPKSSWVYVYLDEESNEYFIDRPSPNTVCQQSPEESGFEAGDTYLLIPDTMYKGTGIPECATVFNSQVDAEIDEKQNNQQQIHFPTYCDSKDGKASGTGIKVEVEKTIKISEKLKKAVKPLADFQIAIDNANKNFVGVGDTRGFFQALRQNDVTIQSFNNTIAIYQQNLAKASKRIAGWISNILVKVKEKMLRKFSIAGNIAKGAAPTSGRFVTNDLWNKAMKALACAFNRLLKFLPDLILKALSSFLGKAINATKCLVENFIGGFIGQLLGQLSGLINGVFKGVSSALSKLSGAIGGALDLVDAIGSTLDSLLSIFDCEIKTCVGEDNVVKWSIVDGPKPERITLDFASIFRKAKDVGKKFEALTDVPKDITNYQFNFDVEDGLKEIFDKCDPGPLFCGGPTGIIWGGTGSGGSGNPVISVTGDLLGVDIITAGNYTSAPLIDFEDLCGNGNGGTGTVIIGPITGIGTVGVGTTGGITGIITDGTGGGGTGGQFGQGTTGIGITHYVTVRDLTPAGIVGSTDNRFFIDGKQQQTLTFQRGNTYILNQEDESNYGHPLRLSRTKKGKWGGGREYTRGVTIDGIPGLGVSATDTAYTRLVVNNNTPNTLYYYCDNHPMMGGVINVVPLTDEDDGEDDDGTTTTTGGTTTTTGGTTTTTGGTTGETTTTTGGTTTTTTTSFEGRNASLVVSAVNSNGGVIAVKNLKGGTGYNECMANVITHGGSGTGFTIRIVKTSGGSIKAISINSKGTGYQLGDILTIISRTTTTTTTTGGGSATETTTIGITKVLINSSGYGYLPAPDGSLGGMNRTWANRCQTIVQRKSLDWDSPYSEGDVITLYSGDWVQLPGKSRVYIDENFNASKLPGAQITGVSSYIPKDMSDFPLTDKTGDSSSLTSTNLNYNFSTATLIPTFAPDGLFDWQGQGPTGIARSDSTNPDVNATIADWNFYLNGEYLGLFQQNEYAEVPQIRIGDIAYRVGTPRTYVATDPYASQRPWVRTADILNPTDWVLTDSQGWSSFLKNYGIYPAVDDPQYKVIGTSSATWRVATFVPGQYTVEMQADNVGTIYWDGVKLGSTLPYAGHNRELKFNFFAGDVEPAIHEIKVEIENLIHREVSKQASTRIFANNPAAVAWVVKDPYGAIIKTSLDAYGVDENYTDILYGYESYFSIEGYNIKEDDDEIIGEVFDCEDDYKRARLLGFTDCDIRAYLEANPEIILDACMRGKLDDDNWGRCDGDLMVSITAPGCPKDPCLPNNTYPVIVCLDEIVIENPGFGFDCCKDTVKIEPSNGAKAEIVECRDGQLIRIKVIDCGAGFTELPEISINTETGFNTILKPIMKFHRPEHGGTTFSDGTPVIQVVDCVGKVV